MQHLGTIGEDKDDNRYIDLEMMDKDQSEGQDFNDISVASARDKEELSRTMLTN